LLFQHWRKWRLTAVKAEALGRKPKLQRDAKVVVMVIVRAIVGLIIRIPLSRALANR
jgi:hypothetical protein